MANVSTANMTDLWYGEVVERYRARTPRSLAAFERSHPLIPGGVPAGLAFMSPYPVYVERGEGAFVWDADGNRMLDLMCGDWLLPLGHCDPAVTTAVAAQLAKGTTFCSPDPSLGYELARLLQQRMPSLERIRFTASGTEATQTALRLARAFTGRPKVAKMRGGYHGTHDVSLIANGRYQDPDAVPPGLIPGTADGVVLLPFNDADAAEALIEAHGSDLAAVIVEPMLGGTGMVPATREFLQRLRAVTERCGVVLIFDEVVTFPISPVGAQHLFEVRPDLTTFGKAIGGGLPLGAFGGSADIMELVDPVVDPTTQMRHASTLGGSPICLAAGVAQVGQLTPDVHQKLDHLGESLREGVRDVARRLDVPLQVTGMGHTFGLHWTPTPVTDFETSLTADRQIMGQIMLDLLNAGFLVFKSGVGTVSSPMTDDDVWSFVAAIEHTIRAAGLVH